jgi:LacI family transcriptional regulator
VYDVAKAAGVSTASVSRYFRTPDKVSPATQEAIRTAVDTLGYIPSGLARGLAERHSGVIGMYSFSDHEPDELEIPQPSPDGEVAVIHEASATQRSYPLFADEVLHGVELECTIRGLPLAVGWQKRDTGGVSLDEIARRVDGLVVLPGVMSQSRLKHLARTKPLVLVSQQPQPELSVPTVTVDNEGGMRRLAEHLITDHGYRTFWVAGPVDDFDRSARHRGLLQALETAGLEPPNQTALGNAWLRSDTRSLLAELLAGHQQTELPDAIVCISDQIALGVIEALTDAGIDVPHDVAVTGFDGIDAGRFIKPALTTVRQPMDLIGRVAVQLLSDLIAEDTDATAHRILPVQVLLRASCGCEL